MTFQQWAQKQAQEPFDWQELSNELLTESIDVMFVALAILLLVGGSLL